MAVLSLRVEINGNQSHDELLTNIEAKQEAAPIRLFCCRIYVHEEDFGIPHPHFSFIRSTTTLEHVEFSSFGGNACIDALLDAVSQNHSIQTVRLYQIDCSAYAVQKLMERMIRWEVQGCRFIGHPSKSNESTCNIEELHIQNNDPSVIDFMSSIGSWPVIRRLSIKMDLTLDLQFVHLVEHVIRAAPILQELTLDNVSFEDPTVLQSFSTLVFNAPSPDLKWHLNYCKFDPNTKSVLETIVKCEEAKTMRVKLSLSEDNYGVLRTIMSESSCVGDLDIISDQYGYGMLEILPLLQEQPFPSTYYPCTSIHLTIHTPSLERYRKIINSIQHWTPRVKKLFLKFASYGRPSRPLFRSEMMQVVRNNLHLQVVELDLDNVKYYDDKITTNAFDRCRAFLERNCERNRKLHAALNEPDSIPLNIWPYVYHLASRGGADMLYWHLHDNAGYTINGWHSCSPPPPPQKMQEMSTTRRQSHDSTAAERKRKRA